MNADDAASEWPLSLQLYIGLTECVNFDKCVTTYTCLSPQTQQSGQGRQLGRVQITPVFYNSPHIAPRRLLWAPHCTSTHPHTVVVLGL